MRVKETYLNDKDIDCNDPSDVELMLAEIRYVRKQTDDNTKAIKTLFHMIWFICVMAMTIAVRGMQ